MKVYISADMEGIAGVVNYRQIDYKSDLYPEARQQMIAEVNAAISGALAGGATGVLVNDAHDTMTNLRPGDIDSRAALISGTGKPFSMMQGVVDSDAAVFIGYHAMAGTGMAVLDHTYSGKIYRLTINGMETGETGFNASIAGYFGVPVIFIAGDRAVCAEASQIITGIETVVTKVAVARTSARCVAPAICCESIAAGVENAVKRYKGGIRKIPPYTQGNNIDLVVELITTEMADLAQLIPGWKRVKGRTLAANCRDMVTAAGCFFSLLRLTGGYPDRLI